MNSNCNNLFTDSRVRGGVDRRFIENHGSKFEIRSGQSRGIVKRLAHLSLVFLFLSSVFLPCFSMLSIIVKRLIKLKFCLNRNRRCGNNRLK